jgi:hypothetical protein
MLGLPSLARPRIALTRLAMPCLLRKVTSAALGLASLR